MAKVKVGEAKEIIHIHVQVNYGAASMNVTQQARKTALELTEREFRKYASKLFGIVNKRINRIEGAKGVVSPALNALKNRGIFHFAVRGKGLTELINEYNIASAFYNLDTGTLKGARAFTDQLKNILGEHGIEDKSYINALFDLFHSIRERIPTIAQGQMGTNEILQEIYEEDYNNALNHINNDKAVREEFIMNVINNLANRIAEESYAVPIDEFSNSLF